MKLNAKVNAYNEFKDTAKRITIKNICLYVN